MDEYQRFATSTTADFLEEGRKYNLGVVFAHQTLYQITDQRIRNASRHAGTLVALGVTRPDAEQLAGEFPFEPRAEWTEEIEEADGVEPKYVFSPTPAEDIFLNRHTNPHVDKVACILFDLSPRWTKERVMDVVGIDYRNADIIQVPVDERKSAGIEPRGETTKDPRPKIAAHDANGLLVDAMAGKLVEKEALLEKLLWAETWVPRVRMGLPEDPNFGSWTVPLRDPKIVSTMYFELSNVSPSLIQEETCDCHLRIDDKAHGHERYTIGRLRPRRPGDPLGLHLVSCKVQPLTEEQKARNETVWQRYRAWALGLVNDEVRSWLQVLLEDFHVLFESSRWEAFRLADMRLIQNAWINRWDGDWKWHGQLKTEPDGELGIDVYKEDDMESELLARDLESSGQCASRPGRV